MKPVIPASGVGTSMIANFTHIGKTRRAWIASAGAGWSDFYRYESGAAWGGRAGLQIAW